MSEKQSKKVWNVVMSLSPEHEYHGWNIGTMFNDWGILKIFECTRVSLDSHLLAWVDAWILLPEATYNIYERWFNNTLDKMLKSLWLRSFNFLYFNILWKVEY